MLKPFRCETTQPTNVCLTFGNDNTKPYPDCCNAICLTKVKWHL